MSEAEIEAVARAYCSTFRAEDGKPLCCDSCHDDHDGGLYDLIDDEKLGVLVCCTVYRWITETQAGRAALDHLRAQKEGK